MKPQSFRKRERIRSKQEFTAIYQRGIRRHSEHFTVILYNNRAGTRRLGVTVGKKVGNAVKRNRIKRLLREFFRLNKERFSDSQDMVIIARKNLRFPMAYGDIERELEPILVNKTNA